MNIVSNLIFHCNHCEADTAFITIHECTAAAPSRPSGLLNAKFTFEGKFPTNHFRTYSSANECLTTLSLTVFTQVLRLRAVLWATIERKSVISLQHGHFDPKFQVQGVAHPPPIIFARLVRPINALKLCCWQFSQRETLQQTFFKRSPIFYGNRPFCVFRPPLGDLVATYDDHLRLIGKRVVDFLLALIVLFSLTVTAEALRAIIGSKSAILLQWGSVDPKFQVEGVAPRQPLLPN